MAPHWQCLGCWKSSDWLLAGQHVPASAAATAPPAVRPRACRRLSEPQHSKVARLWKRAQQFCRWQACASPSCLLGTVLTHCLHAGSLTRRPAVFVTARVHPGETPASFMMQGLITFLLSSHPEAVLLRREVTWVIMPMLNPDGVFLGNYRSGTPWQALCAPANCRAGQESAFAPPASTVLLPCPD